MSNFQSLYIKKILQTFSKFRKIRLLNINDFKGLSKTEFKTIIIFVYIN